MDAIFFTIVGLTLGVDAAASAGQLLLWQAYSALFILIAVADIAHRRILFSPLVALALLALLDAALLPASGPTLPAALAGGLCGGFLFWLAYLGGRLYRRWLERRHGAVLLGPVFGLGDVQLMAVCGLLLGLPNALLALALAVILGGLGAALKIITAAILGRSYQRFSSLPYAPFILLASYVVLLFPDQTWRF